MPNTIYALIESKSRTKFYIGQTFRDPAARLAEHRYGTKNCNAQCRSCNRFDEGNIQGYRRGLIDKYGERTVLLLESLKNQTNKITEFEYKEMIAFYKSEVKRLEQEKGFKIRK